MMLGSPHDRVIVLDGARAILGVFGGALLPQIDERFQRAKLALFAQLIVASPGPTLSTLCMLLGGSAKAFPRLKHC